MGRDGHLLFEADDDLNILEYIHEHARELVGGSWIPKPNEKISSAALLVLTNGDGGTRISNRVARKQTLKQRMSEEVFKQHLDSGVAKLLIEKYRELGLRQAELEGFDDTSQGLNKGFGYYGEYMNVVLAAHMMRIGAVVDDEFRTYLRELVPKIPSRYGYQMSFCDDGFRDPGKAQFLTALDNYTSGQPRVLGPSCWTCGKTKAELGRHLVCCSRCLDAHYCGRGCQKVEWKKHKKICQPPGRGLNA